MTKGLPAPASPCVGLCRLDEGGGYCLGCLRTLDEIAGWSGFDDEQKRAVWRRLLALRPKVKDKRCERCGAAFRCGDGGAEGGCWCADLPQVLPLPYGHGDCLCPDCLRQHLRESYLARGLTPPL
ncbi:MULTISPECIES: cysteine-rich CWC family protein [Chromobacterium]|uniref:Cysteine-rich CWC family protein n=1 Tax=Chromobacterium aquaticum TaxID=467180 RepID=A0ABV8ZV46_9NEIS|nr:cysteine-rich CWC family protein [Chromobacterium aquaticum]MCD5361411.1 DUF1289 domain-containing protein [Chromobacterium aquaticum]